MDNNNVRFRCIGGGLYRKEGGEGGGNGGGEVENKRLEY